MKSETETLGELFKALALAQNEMEAATTDATNPFFKSKYAKLEHVVKASRPFLSKHGLSVSQRPFVLENGQRVLLTRLCHSSGEWMEGCMSINPPKEDIQAMGSYITYLRRYNYSCITGVVTEDESDDDGEKAKSDQKKEREVDDLKEKIKSMELEKIEVVAKNLAVKLNISDADSVFRYISSPSMKKSTIFNKNGIESMDQSKCDKFLSWYQKWLAENPPEF